MNNASGVCEEKEREGKGLGKRLRNGVRVCGPVVGRLNAAAFRVPPTLFVMPFIQFQILFHS